MYFGDEQRMARVLGPLPHKWNIQMKPLDPASGLDLALAIETTGRVKEHFVLQINKSKKKSST